MWHANWQWQFSMWLMCLTIYQYLIFKQIFSLSTRLQLLITSLLTEIMVLTPFMLIFLPGGPWLASTRFHWSKDNGDGGDNWSCKTCKAPAKSLPPTNQHPTFYSPDPLPVAQPTVSEHWKENYSPLTEIIISLYLDYFQIIRFSFAYFNLSSFCNVHSCCLTVTITGLLKL